MSPVDPINLTREELFSIIENLPYATGVFATDLHYIYYNRAGEVMSGIPLLHAMGKKPNDLLPSNVCDTFVPLVEEAIQTKTPVEKEIQICFGKEIITLRLNYVPILNGHGEVNCVLGITQDVSDQQFVKNQLNLAESISESGSWLLKVLENKIWLSDQAARILGIDSHSAYTIDSFINSFTLESRDFLKKCIERSCKTGDSFDQEFKLVLKSNFEKCLRLIGQPNRFGDSVQSISGFLQDITVHKNQELSLQRALVKANYAIQAKNDFLANISHEIRTPLNAIAGFSELICDPGLLSDLELSDIKERIKINVKNLTRIIDGLIDISRAEQNVPRAQRTNVPLRRLVGEIEAFGSHRARMKNLNFSVECFLDPGQLIYIDFSKTFLILRNLVENAVKFTSKGFVQVKFDERKNDHGEKDLIIFVEDTGIGISADQKKVLFTPFQQGDASSTRENEGLGLGLVLAKKYAQQLNGNLQLIWSEPNQGSRFEFILVDVTSGP
ncbi:MAG: PAS domain-containing sensor histidine kinase [Deltaproteobacteria bacterium]|jgi:PAS domain S-box-containing protein|nr:PAS domain-containing sensor histidine kinase [Deltaproteobacteria bacterium]